jgi:dTMP kinase
MNRGKFITFEGLDGAGKSTHLAWCVNYLEQRLGAGRVVRTREPGGTALGEDLRTMLLSRTMHADTEALLMFAARGEHIELVIEPALKAGCWVICDRFTDASYAYQCGGRGISFQRLKLLEEFTHPTLQPDLTLLFDLSPAIAEQRRSAVREADKFESEPNDFHERTRAAYLRRVSEDPSRFAVLDAACSPDEVRKQLEDILSRL